MNEIDKFELAALEGALAMLGERIQVADGEPVLAIVNQLSQAVDTFTTGYSSDDEMTAVILRDGRTPKHGDRVTIDEDEYRVTSVNSDNISHTMQMRKVRR